MAKHDAKRKRKTNALTKKKKRIISFAGEGHEHQLTSHETGALAGEGANPIRGPPAYEIDKHDDDLIDVHEACREIGGELSPIDPSSLYRGIKAGRYSKPIRVGAQSVRWIRGELRSDIERMKAERDSAA